MKNNNRKEIDTYIAQVSRETGLSPAAIELDLLSDAVNRAKQQYQIMPAEECGVAGNYGNPPSHAINTAKAAGFMIAAMLIAAAAAIILVIKR